MTRTLVITSGKGGVGKTNRSVNTALELARQNFRTCLFDADLGLANVNILLGIHPEKTLEDCISGDHTLEDILLRSDYGIDIIPGGSGIETLANLGKENIDTLLEDLSKLQGYDYFLIDTSSGISRNVISFCLASSETVLVITSEATSLADGYALIKVLASNNYTGTIKIIVNKCPDVPKSKETFLRLKAAVDKHLKITIAAAGTILFDPHFDTAISKQVPLLTLFPNSIASQCIRAMVANLLDGSTSPEVGDADFVDFWQRYHDFSQSDLKLPESSERKFSPSPPPEEEKEQNNDTLQVDREITPQEIVNEAETPPAPKHVQVTVDDLCTSLHLESPISLLSKSLELHGRGELSEDKLHKIFSSDPSLMVKALRLLHSPGSIRTKRITSMQQVFRELGQEVLSSILVTACTESAHSENGNPQPQFLDEFWLHSYKCGLLAEFIAETIDYPYPEEAFLTGLLHDIGRLSLQSKFPETYKGFSLSFSHKEILETEKQVFGTTHAEIGSEILRAYRINSFMADAVRYHTDPEVRIETAFDLVKIIYVASQLTDAHEQESMKMSELRSKSLLDLTSAQILTGLEMAELRSQGLADHFHIPLTEKAVQNGTLDTRTLFRRQAVEYALLQGTMPSHSPIRDVPQIIHQLHTGMEILFDIKPVICLLANKERTHLQAAGYPHCFGWEALGDMRLSLTSRKSVITGTFATGNLHYALNGVEKSILSLADEQIMRTLGKNGLVCIPMASQGVSKGVILAGMDEKDIPTIEHLQGRFIQFGAQCALNILVSEQLKRERLVQDTSPPSSDSDTAPRGNLIQLTGKS